LSKNSGCRFDSECSELKRQLEFSRIGCTKNFGGFYVKRQKQQGQKKQE